MSTGNRVRFCVWPLACQLDIEDDVNDQKSLSHSLSLSLRLVQNFQFGFARPIEYYLSIRLNCFHWLLFMHVWHQFTAYSFGSFCLSLSNICIMYAKKVIWSWTCGQNELVVTCSTFHNPFPIQLLIEWTEWKKGEALNPRPV